MNTTASGTRPGTAAGVGEGTTPAGLARIELRKAVDTRAGLALVASVGVLTIVVSAVQLAFGNDTQRGLHALVVDAQLPAGLLLPVVGLLAVTSEWSQRTALATFTLVPGRMRVVAAKALAVSLLGVLAAVAATVSGTTAFAVGQLLDRSTGGWSLDVSLLPKIVLLQWLNVIWGFAFGLLLLNSAPAIVAFFAVPTAWSILGAVVPGLEPVAAWLDLSRAMGPLTDDGTTGREWAQLLTAALLWIGLPALLGAVRVRRTEIG